MSAPWFSPFTYLSSHPQGVHKGKVEPTPEFIREVEAAVTLAEGDSKRLAQWIVDRIEEHGAQGALLVFDHEGNGPFCSYCHSLAAWSCDHPERSLAGRERAGSEVSE